MLMLSRILITFVSFKSGKRSQARRRSRRTSCRLFRRAVGGSEDRDAAHDRHHDGIACGRLIHRNDGVGRANRVRGVPAYLLRAGWLPDRIRQQPVGYPFDLALRTAMTERRAMPTLAVPPSDGRVAVGDL